MLNDKEIALVRRMAKEEAQAIAPLIAQRLAHLLNRHEVEIASLYAKWDDLASRVGALCQILEDGGAMTQEHFEAMQKSCAEAIIKKREEAAEAAKKKIVPAQNGNGNIIVPGRPQCS